MERGTTLFLKTVLLVIALPILALCIVGLPWMARETVGYFPAYWVYPVLGLSYLGSIPYFVALYQAFQLLTYIDKNNAFSELSVRALKLITYCAVLICIICAACLPFLYFMADADDAPGLIFFGMVPGFASAVIAVFAAVLQRLLRNAIDLKSENDLTI
ncbi:DUF2975 domain-containing protein [Paenibacillus koleovorans]|uniref:DUF2975 domain-containing protein n=1 Tax=Paenibacillus koleovorans TaxID=121608 RepID=UPI001580159B|nr:DUF2975 domain-containing protein [Paenibacillus koleovorans]